MSDMIKIILVILMFSLSSYGIGAIITYMFKQEKSLYEVIVNGDIGEIIMLGVFVILGIMLVCMFPYISNGTIKIDVTMPYITPWLVIR